MTTRWEREAVPEIEGRLLANLTWTLSRLNHLLPIFIGLPYPPEGNALITYWAVVRAPNRSPHSSFYLQRFPVLSLQFTILILSSLALTFPPFFNCLILTNRPFSSRHSLELSIHHEIFFNSNYYRRHLLRRSCHILEGLQLGS
jgi:hypothetical protein